MKVKVSEASGIVLDWLTAKADGSTFSEEYPHLLKSGFETPSYSHDWSQASPITAAGMVLIVATKAALARTWASVALAV